MVFLVTYTLRGYRPANDYIRVENAIRAISGTHPHLGESRWFVETELSSQQIAERLAPLTYVGDRIFVDRVYGHGYAYSLTPAEIHWLRSRNYSSTWDILKTLVPLPVPKPVQTGLRSALGGLFNG